MDIPQVTLQDLANHLLSLPDDAPINMVDDENHEGTCGCLMTNYGRFKGWKFDTSDACISTPSRWVLGNRWKDSEQTIVAEMDEYVFNLFTCDADREMCYIAKGWKDVLKEEFKN